jgi:hypothetical protein
MTRAEKVVEAQRLRAKGLTYREIGERLGVALTTAHEYIRDPDLSRKKARRRARAGVCIDCGAPTDGSRTSPAKRCAYCDRVANAERNRARARPRRDMIEWLWAEGKTGREIQEVIGSILNITTLRHAGYNLPHRRSPDQIARMQRPGAAERMARAREARKAAA